MEKLTIVFGVDFGGCDENVQVRDDDLDMNGELDDFVFCAFCSEFVGLLKLGVGLLSDGLGADLCRKFGCYTYRSSHT